MATTVVNVTEAEYWNASTGQAWVRNQAMLDTLMAGVLDALVEHAAPARDERVLDIGCGTGASTLVLAERVGPAGHVTGVDIAATMLERAHERAAGVGHVDFLLADAQVHGFAPDSVDLVASRFGMMFFADPVAAFRNLSAALAPDGRLCFVAWGPLADNPWFRVARDAAVARLGAPAPQPPTAPGPLAFADGERVCALMRSAGLAAVGAERVAVDLVWHGDFDALADLATTLGPAVRIIREKGGGPDDGAAIRDGVAAGLGRFRGQDGVRVPAALNMFTARRG